MLSEIINIEAVCTMKNEHLIVIHFISPRFGGFVRIVHISSCSNKEMPGFVAYVQYILMPYR